MSDFDKWWDQAGPEFSSYAHANQAWKHQQRLIDQKDAEIKQLNEQLLVIDALREAESERADRCQARLKVLQGACAMPSYYPHGITISTSTIKKALWGDA